jgi:adenylate cyclase, class 2
MPSRVRHYTRAMSLPKKAVGASRKISGKLTSTEIEVKLPVSDRQAMLRLLKKLKAKGGDRVHEMNTLYDTPGGSLASEDRLVRIRLLHAAPLRQSSKSGPSLPLGAVLTYKGPVTTDDAGGRAPGALYKIREEHEVRVEDGEALVRVFQGMGLQPRFRYEKYRTTFRLPGVPGVLVELDETPVGDFLELEGTAASIDRAAGVLGYASADYIVKSYGQLFIEHVRRSQGKESDSLELSSALRTAEMVFPRRK